LCASWRRPGVWALLDGYPVLCTSSLTGRRGYVEVELHEPTEDDVAQVRALIEKVGEKG
jgi:hypothetical protein